GKRGVVIDNDPAFAIQDLPAGREDRHVADAILLRQLRVLAALHHLQAPQSVGEHKEDKQNDVLHDGEPEGGNFFFAAEHQSSVPASRHRRPSLNRNRRLRWAWKAAGNVNSIITRGPSCPKY